MGPDFDDPQPDARRRPIQLVITGPESEALAVALSIEDDLDAMVVYDLCTAAAATSFRLRVLAARRLPDSVSADVASSTV